MIDDRTGVGTTIVRVVIRGRVQGVGFRAWVESMALQQGLEGWVRNLRDGAVEAVFCGPSDKVAMMLIACRQGPPAARVDGFEQWNGDNRILASRRVGELFSVLPTA